MPILGAGLRGFEEILKRFEEVCKVLERRTLGLPVPFHPQRIGA